MVKGETAPNWEDTGKMRRADGGSKESQRSTARPRKIAV